MPYFFFNPQAPKSFSPDQVPGLKIWCKADGELTKDVSDNVSAWGETGGSLVQVTASGAAQPLYEADGGDGNPAVHFDGANHVMASTNVTLDASFTMVAVVNSDVQGSNSIWSHNFNNDTEVHYLIYYPAGVIHPASTIRIQAQRNDGSSVKTVAHSAQGTNVTYRHECDNSNATHKLFIDGVEQVMGTSSTGNPTTSRAGPVRIGGYSDTIRLLDGRVREFLFYTEKISSSDATSVESYLSDRW